MKLILRDNIHVGERVRQPLPADIIAMADSIDEKGLLHPIVLTQEDDPWLVAGETRLLAIALLEERAMDGGIEGTYKHNETILPTDVIPYTTVGELTAQQLLEYEIAENIIRTDIPWPDRVRALAKLHTTSDNVTSTRTARMLINAGDKRDESAVQMEVSRALIISDNLDNPKVAEAKSLTEAFNIIRKDTTALSSKVLSEAAPLQVTNHSFYSGAMEDFMPGLSGVNTIISDPPYGVEADSWTTKFRENPHNYKDSLSKALSDAAFIFSEGLKITAERANLFMFCAPQHWLLLAELGLKEGWAVWPRPLVWYKSREGIRPQGMQGFCYTYESILYATKGGKGLVKSINDVIEIYKVHRNERLHGAQKPVDLYRLLIEISSMPGDIILDPTCGSGTIFPACNVTKTRGIGIEREPEFRPICEGRFTEGLNGELSEGDSSLEDL